MGAPICGKGHRRVSGRACVIDEERWSNPVQALIPCIMSLNAWLGSMISCKLLAVQEFSHESNDQHNDNESGDQGPGGKNGPSEALLCAGESLDAPKMHQYASKYRAYRQQCAPWSNRCTHRRRPSRCWTFPGHISTEGEGRRGGSEAGWLIAEVFHVSYIRAIGASAGYRNQENTRQEKAPNKTNFLSSYLAGSLPHR